MQHTVMVKFLFINQELRWALMSRTKSFHLPEAAINELDTCKLNQRNISFVCGCRSDPHIFIAPVTTRHTREPFGQIRDPAVFATRPGASSEEFLCPHD